MTLMTLVLDNNIIGNDGAAAIADFLRYGKTTSTTLYLANNYIGDDDGIKH
jgi:hypothetical protein